MLDYGPGWEERSTLTRLRKALELTRSRGYRLGLLYVAFPSKIDWNYRVGVGAGQAVLRLNARSPFFPSMKRLLARNARGEFWNNNPRKEGR